MDFSGSHCYRRQTNGVVAWLTVLMTMAGRISLGRYLCIDMLQFCGGHICHINLNDKGKFNYTGVSVYGFPLC